MTKREAAERNIEAGGMIVDGAGDCKKCILKEECPYDKSNHTVSCVLFCKQWLADNPEETEWQELDLSDHPKDLLSYENWDFMTEDDDTIGNICGPEFKLRFLLNAVENCKTIHYRKRQPEKTEPEVIIKQSGGTWVARYDGVDYLCIEQNAYTEESIGIGVRDGDTPKLLKMISDGYESNTWKQIKDIEITDDIAKLRPMVWVKLNSEPDTLYGINDTESFLWNTGKIFTKYIRLATVSDLENEK